MVFLIMMVLSVAGCGAAAVAGPADWGVPTVAALFDASPPTPQPAPTHAPSATPRPTATLGPGAPATATAAAASRSSIREQVIYDEALSPDWTGENSWGATIDMANHSRAYSGTASVAITPTEDYGGFFLAVRPGAASSYPITGVLGVSLWIGSGNDFLSPDDLAMTVVGSNQHTYWVKEDSSVKLDDLHFFSESRLFYLGISRMVPPEKWVEAVVWLDKLPYEPDFQYVTGVYVKNDAGFRHTFYVDRVALLLLSTSP